jgi:putative polyhydroxyalkanoate system protein
MKIVRSHNMDKQAAKDTLDALIPHLVQQYGDKLSKHSAVWSGDVLDFSFEARGFDIKGTLKVTGDEVILDARLPFLAGPFEGTIRPAVERELDRILGK